MPIDPIMLHLNMICIELLTIVDVDLDRNQSVDCISRVGRLTGRCVQTSRRRYQCGDCGVHAVSAHNIMRVCL